MKDKDDILTFKDWLVKIPMIARNIKGLMKSNRYSTFNDKTEPVGLGWAIERATKKNPEGKALLYQDRVYVYEEMNSEINRWCHYFIEKGLKKGDVVAVFIVNSPELLICTAALAKLGVICAMLNISLHGKILAHSIDLVKSKAIVVGDELVETANNVLDSMSGYSIERYIVKRADSGVESADANYESILDQLGRFPVHNPIETQNNFVDDPAFYIFTSGTTGLPKASIYTHGKWTRSFGGFGFGPSGLSKNDVMYVTLPFYHATALAICWGMVLAGCGGLAIREKFSASEFWHDCRKYQATSIGYVGELCRYLLNCPESPDDTRQKVKHMVGNGLRPAIWGEFKRRFDIHQVVEFYAASDGNCGFANVFNFDYTVGFCSDFAIVKYNPETENPLRNAKGFMTRVKKGDSGLLISKICDSKPLEGYTEKEKTEKVILKDVFITGDRWWISGDLLRDIGFGHAQFVDRLGDTFRWKGENVSTMEVENILNEVDFIEESIVYGVEVPDTNGRAGMAVLRPKPGFELDFNRLGRHLFSVLPTYAVPLFLRIKLELETTGTFKYQKSELKKQGFSLRSLQDPVYVLLPAEETYIPLTELIQAEIEQGERRF